MVRGVCAVTCRTPVAHVHVAGVPMSMANASRVRGVPVAVPVAVAVAAVREAPDCHHAEADRACRERDEVEIHV